MNPTRLTKQKRGIFSGEEKEEEGLQRRRPSGAASSALEGKRSGKGAAVGLRREFENPGAQYRGKPFWAWNGKLEEGELRRQIRILHQMGMGGFFMHSRVGLSTPFLSEEWFRRIRDCLDEAQKLGMEAWLYDEDRWPSGAAGGLVTRIPKYRQKRLRCLLVPPRELSWPPEALAAFEAEVSGFRAKVLRRLRKGDPAPKKRGLLFVSCEAPLVPWYNGYTYLDTLSREAVEEFLRKGYDPYARRHKKAFGRLIPGVFTDEPHYGSVNAPFSRVGYEPLEIPWTRSLPRIFEERYGYDLIARLPELFFDTGSREGDSARTRFHFIDCLTHLFTTCFAGLIGKWCEERGLLFTGHVLDEQSPLSQTLSVGSAMRFYEHMQAPGIDILMEDNREYDTAKQCASVVHQMGRRWMLSELYGCTGWDFTFEGHKAVGDWQAALGVNLRCHHLSWYTMAGEAKRDYPASIFFHSPWWPHYSHVEDYFARVNVLLSQGKPLRDLLVIHPVESTWTKVRGGWRTDPGTLKLNRDLERIRNWLLESQIDFDYGDEEMLSRLGGTTQGSAGPLFRLGKAEYPAVLVPRMLTIRATTLDRLRVFREAGGKVVFVSPPPDRVDALDSGSAGDFSKRCSRVPFRKQDIVRAVEPLCRRISVRDRNGRAIPSLLYQLRRSQKEHHLFLVNTDRKQGFEEVTLWVKGVRNAEEWEPSTGERFRTRCRQGKGRAAIHTSLPPSGSRLFLFPEKPSRLPYRPILEEVRRVPLPPHAWPIARSEPNVLVLDKPVFQIGESSWRGPLEILKVDQAARKAAGFPQRGGSMVQPWAREGKWASSSLTIKLSHSLQAEFIPPGPLWLAMEQPHRWQVQLNGNPLSSKGSKEWWVDPSIRLLELQPEMLLRGKNELLLKLDSFCEGDDLEACFLLGEFGVRLSGTKTVLIPPPSKLKPGNWCLQGLPFYSAGVTYTLPFEARLRARERVFLTFPSHRSTFLRISVDGREAGRILWPPDEVEITPFCRFGEQELQVELISSRRNSFGPLHVVPARPRWVGPREFRTEGKEWREGYALVPYGLMKPPVLSFRRAVPRSRMESRRVRISMTDSNRESFGRPPFKGRENLLASS